LIGASARSGRPTVGAAFGGNLLLFWLLPKVVPD